MKNCSFLQQQNASCLAYYSKLQWYFTIKIYVKPFLDFLPYYYAIFFISAFQS